MIRLANIRVPLDFDFSGLKRLCAKKLSIPAGGILSAELSKKSVDARKKSDVHFIISVDISLDHGVNVEKLMRLKNVSEVEAANYEIKKIDGISEKMRPVIVGFGPGGMFAALVLATSGARPIVLERGFDLDRRVEAVETFRTTGSLDERCNVQFGEGGAGTFSDGKLTTGIKDSRISTVLRWFTEFGAPEEIRYLAKPHIGTDRLRDVVKNIRKRVIKLGGEVRFGAKFDGFDTENGRISRISYCDEAGRHFLETNNLILATGHSARDVFKFLHEKNVTLSQKSFSVGVRAEHLRSDIDRAMYGGFAGHPALKAADYKLAVHLPGGRTLYTFCMCPGGYVMAASSEEGRLTVNGMSCFARDGENSNSALLVNVTPDDFGSAHPLAGVEFQRKIEEKAFIAGGSDYSAPVILVGDMLKKRVGTSFGRVKPTYLPGVKFAALEEYLPQFVCDTIREGIVEMGKRIKGFDDGDTVLTGVESRSSSPVRINRGENLQSVSIAGLYPCGEGAGYAGGIMSAAVDGMKCAEVVILSLLEEKVSEFN